jgi:bifunctional enzyme CysN/CysC
MSTPTTANTTAPASPAAAPAPYTPNASVLKTIPACYAPTPGCPAYFPHDHPSATAQGVLDGAAPGVIVEKDRFYVVVVGHVDHGKSTFVGRLLADTDSLPTGKLDQVRQACAAEGMDFEYAFLLDALLEEQEQNITIDTTRIFFSTPRREYAIIDAPGHREFLKNMVTGAASASAAFLLIDSREGVQDQTRRHALLLSLLGVRQLIVLVNKMDLSDYSEARYHGIVAEYTPFLATLGLKPAHFIPVSARHGGNIASRATDTMPWWSGPTVVEALDSFTDTAALDNKPLRLPLQDVYRWDDRRIFAGRIESGRIRPGDTILFQPGGKTATVKTLENWPDRLTEAEAKEAANADGNANADVDVNNANSVHPTATAANSAAATAAARLSARLASNPVLTSAGPGESVGITLAEQIFVERGAIAAAADDAPLVTQTLHARVFWLGKDPLRPQRTYKLRLTTQETTCVVSRVERVIDSVTLETTTPAAGTPLQVNRHEVADIVLRTQKPVAFDSHEYIGPLGRFVLLDNQQIAGGGILPVSPVEAARLRQNIHPASGKVDKRAREARNGHPGAVIWLTGLSGSGKSTIASELERQLFDQGRQVYWVDGDNLRLGLSHDLGFSEKDRAENIRRAGELARHFADAGTILILSLISPGTASRNGVRERVEPGRFIEVFVNAPLDVCAGRDPKGLYKKAQAGEIQNFTGISAPYEAPEKPEIELRTDLMSVAECVAKVMERVSIITRTGGATDDWRI